MKNFDFKLMNLIKAATRLQEACDFYDGTNDMIRDSIIQRFEFSYELSHKTLSEFLKQQGVTLENTFPRTIFKKAYANGLLADEQVWLGILEDRNATSHIYSEKVADEIADRICNHYVHAIKQLTTILQDSL